jgi:hypothetical protein
MTGYSGPLDMPRAAGVREILKKPLLSADLAQCLSEILAPPARASRTG